MKKKNKYLLISILTITLVLLDQIIKFIIVGNDYNGISIIPNVLKLTYIKNTGGAFGVAQDNVMMFILTNLIVIVIIAKFIITQIERIDRKTLTSLVLILAGGIGNLLDRIFRGFVVDYLDINNIIKFPIFNIADIYVVIGWILLIISIFIFWKKEVNYKK